MKLYCFVVIISFYGQMILSENNLCFRKGKKICCSGYRWSENKRQCEECPPGYSGTDCELMCYPPFYGAGCRQTCRCPMELCDAVSGCKIISTTVLQSTDHEITEKRVTTPEYRQGDNNETTQVDGSNNSNITIVSQNIGTRSTFVVFYTTVTLIFVFVSFAMFYGVSSLYKFILSRRQAKMSDLNFTERTNSLYECVDAPRYL
uniref:Protein draper-like n=1 Tax=Crassostrea virginica TaxID=6565 RepID=A0A8B8F0N1_CRAVI|nr:protein draper-like [Crassostrea virginica]